ncbi:hypothetical protein B0H19DRAFT_1069277 [Mycena capillaripes]|nr:hypothetical protein B0H19DRAFT_1069277 [Mycena capillaripes]
MSLSKLGKDRSVIADAMSFERSPGPRRHAHPRAGEEGDWKRGVTREEREDEEVGMKTSRSSGNWGDTRLGEASGRAQGCTLFLPRVTHIPLHNEGQRDERPNPNGQHAGGGTRRRDAENEVDVDPKRERRRSKKGNKRREGRSRAGEEAEIVKDKGKDKKWSDVRKETPVVDARSTVAHHDVDDKRKRDKDIMMLANPSKMQVHRQEQKRETRRRPKPSRAQSPAMARERKPPPRRQDPDTRETSAESAGIRRTPSQSIENKVCPRPKIGGK